MLLLCQCELIGDRDRTVIQNPAPRRPELETAFRHLDELVTSVDVTGLNDDDRDLYLAREHGIRNYGSIGPETDLSGVTFTPVLEHGVSGVWVTDVNSSPFRRIVYFHGGGWRSGSPHDYRSLTAVLARYSGASVLVVNYRLAPENPFPAGLDDCVRAFQWATNNGPTSPGKYLQRRSTAESIFLAGDSAGGNLAAATCLRLIKAGTRLPDRVALIAATLDNAEVTLRVGVDDPVCPPDVLSTCTRMYMPAGHSALEPLISPVYASIDMLTKFPPTLLQVSAIEALAWDSKKFANVLAVAGVRVNLSIWPDLPHVWHQFLGLFPESWQALNEIADFFAGTDTSNPAKRPLQVS